MIITLDGPSASGKSTLARLLAQRLQIYYLNTGLLYRALAYLLMRQCGYTVDLLNTIGSADVDKCLDLSRLVYRYQDGKGMVFFNQEDITGHLKMGLVDQAASVLSMEPSIRQALLGYQRTFALHNDLVAEGRDTGSVVFAQADYKFYVTADQSERALRWQLQQKALGNTYTLQQALDHIGDRDLRDRQRATAPLIIPIGAVVIDDTGLTQEETLAKILGFIRPAA